jgi:hypothetical protein
MKSLKDFIDCFATRGGSIILLLVCTVITGVFVLVAVKYHMQGEGEITLRNAFVAFSGALLGALSNERQANGKNSTSTGVEEKKALQTSAEVVSSVQEDQK